MSQEVENKQQQNTSGTPNTYTAVLNRFDELANIYGGLPSEVVYGAFERAGIGLANQPQIQNQRVKSISPLPADYTKEDLGVFLLNPYSSERALGQVSHALNYTSYPLFKIVKTEADILTYHSYVEPVDIDAETASSKDFRREYRLAEEVRRRLNPEKLGHLFSMQAGTFGKVFYTLRYDIDKSHNKVNTIFAQQLPQNWCWIIGFNNLSKYTVSFDMMYFMQPGTDWRQYGDLFEPYIDDFISIFKEPKRKSPDFVYASVGESEDTVTAKIGGKGYTIYLDNVRKLKNNATNGNPQVFEQNGRWCYYVSLPIDRVWTFEINDGDVGVVTPYAGLLQTFTQQADYEAAQLSLILQPLVKIFTGEMENLDDKAGEATDNFRPSVPMRQLFLQFWNMLMRESHTGGAAFYAAPFKNIKSHDYSESANANDISQKFNSYAMGKAGLTALIPVIDNPHQGVSEYSAKLESRFNFAIYRTFEEMMNYFFEYGLKLKYSFRFKMFGSIYTDDMIRSNALKQLANGDTSQHYILSALDDVSILEKNSMSTVLESNGFLDHLQPPVTSYTQSGDDNNKSQKGMVGQGAPTKTETEVQETKTEKTVTTGE